MTCAGLPELQNDKDVNFILTTLRLDLSAAEASKHFQQELSKALGTSFRLFDSVIHNIKHRH